MLVNPDWKPPDPPIPADHARLSAMCRALILAMHGPQADEPWAGAIIGELLLAARRLTVEDQERLQGELDREVDRLNREG